MGTKDSEEFKNAIKDIASHSHQLDSPFDVTWWNKELGKLKKRVNYSSDKSSDRVRCVEWCRKLAGLSDEDLELSRLKNEYAQFLRIQVRHKFLHGPFVTPPPDGNLCTLPECLGNLMAKQIPYLPRVGPIAPILHHRSPDGRAYISTKQIPGGGVFCYMAVSPDGLKCAIK